MSGRALSSIVVSFYYLIVQTEVEMDRQRSCPSLDTFVLYSEPNPALGSRKHEPQKSASSRAGRSELHLPRNLENSCGCQSCRDEIEEGYVNTYGVKHDQPHLTPTL
jgi:hypothetical protein